MLELAPDQKALEQVVLINPFTQSMVVLHGDDGILSVMLSSAVKSKEKRERANLEII
jgi:hypothetical protein